MLSVLNNTGARCAAHPGVALLVAGVPYALNLELYFSVFLKPISLSLRGVGVLCYTAVSRNLSPPFPLLHCAWLVVRVLWACCVALQSEPEPEPPRSPLRVACCARGRAVGVLCCTAVRARARGPVLHCAWLAVRVGRLWACCVACCVVGALRFAVFCVWICCAVSQSGETPPHLFCARPRGCAL